MRSRRLLTIRSRRCLMSRNEAIKVLGLEKNFEKSELKSVYLEKAKLYHPDKSDTNPEYFEKIKEAYEFLENDKGNFQFSNTINCPTIKIYIHDIFENHREFWNFEKIECS